MNDFKSKINRFMLGRRGIDEFEKFIGIAVLVFLALYIWLHSALCYYIVIIGVVYGLFRLFSTNIPKRHRENMAFVGFFQRRKLNFQQRKTHKFFGCPQCKATLRVPKGKGKITITCNCCGRQFTKRT